MPLKPVFRNVPLSARVPRNVREMLVNLVPVLQKEAQLRGEDWQEIDLSHVVGELLGIRATQEWAERGAKEIPSTEDGWEALVKETIKRIVAEAKQK